MNQDLRVSIVAIMFAVGATVVQGAAPQQGAPASTPRTPRAAAPLDLAGQWVSIVTEDWRWRMLTAPRGDATGIPLNPEGVKVAESWDLARDNAPGQQCK